MKKVFLLIPLLVFLTGCNTKTGSINCTLSARDVVNGYGLESNYKINYTGKYVDSANTYEVVTSNIDSIIDNFEKTLNASYSAVANAYGGYTYEIIKEEGKIISVVDIDYKKMNLEQYVEDQPTLKSYVKDGKLLVEGLKSLYESMGATCE